MRSRSWVPAPKLLVGIVEEGEFCVQLPVACGAILRAELFVILEKELVFGIWARRSAAFLARWDHELRVHRCGLAVG
jgi:hypothetical protein